MMPVSQIQIVGIPKDKTEMYQAFYDEFFINLQGKDNPDLTYRQFRKVLQEMHSKAMCEPFMETINDSLHSYVSFRYDKDVLQEWIREKCCWENEQYIMDELFEGIITDNYPLSRYVFITLRKILYVTTPNPLRLMILKPLQNIIAQEMPKHPEIPGTPFNKMYDILTEGTPEFKDVYHVIRRTKN